jgi:hypothetical protein|uniref:hypothetical protein n=1 Tax=Prosthecobacter sp. TaxID=1965333 RepID=UPI00378382F2
MVRISKKKLWCGLAVTIISLAAWFFWPASNEWSFHRALPRSAQGVQEWYWADGFLPDYSYHLKARITQQEFDNYVKKLGLTPHTLERAYTDDVHWLNWQALPQFTNGWFDPSDSLTATFVSQEGDCWAFAKYEKGNLYVTSLNH